MIHKLPFEGKALLKFTTKLKIALSAIAATFAVTLFQPMQVEARTVERWYDYAENRWRTDARPIRRRIASNKSPIRKRIVWFDRKYKPGSVVIDTSERRLYYVTRKGWAIKYGVGVGRDGFQWAGTHKVTRKAEWPDWRPPVEMISRVKRETGKTLKRFYKGGPDNPMGARGIYIGSTIYRIHGTNQPWTIGKALSSGCIRMANDDVSDLYKRIKVGARIIVRN